jgi:hypothetical protein
VLSTVTGCTIYYVTHIASAKVLCSAIYWVLNTATESQPRVTQSGSTGVPQDLVSSGPFNLHWGCLVSTPIRAPNLQPTNDSISPRTTNNTSPLPVTAFHAYYDVHSSLTFYVIYTTFVNERHHFLSSHAFCLKQQMLFR